MGQDLTHSFLGDGGHPNELVCKKKHGFGEWRSTDHTSMLELDERSLSGYLRITSRFGSSPEKGFTLGTLGGWLPP